MLARFETLSTTAPLSQGDHAMRVTSWNCSRGAWRTTMLAAGLAVGLEAVGARLDLGLGTLEESFRRREA